MRLALPTLFLLAACSTASSTSQDIARRSDTICETPWAEFAARIPHNAHMTEVADPEAFLTEFNAAPPPTDITADHIFALTSHGRVLLSFVSDGCLTKQILMSEADFNEMPGVGL